MNRTQALQNIQSIVRTIKNNDAIIITAQTNLIEDNLLDSLDGLIFFMELDKQCGLSIPEDADLASEGYFKVETLLTLLEK